MKIRDFDYKIPISSDLLLCDWNKLYEKCKHNKDHEIYVRLSRMSPLHIALGHIPLGVPIEAFREIRQEFLGDNPLKNSPEYTLLSEQSSHEDVKSFLLSVGVDKSKIDKLNHLKFRQFSLGMFRPILNEDDLDDMDNNWTKIRRKLLSLYQFQDESIRNKIDESFKIMTNSVYDWIRHIDLYSNIVPVTLQDVPVT